MFFSYVNQLLLWMWRHSCITDVHTHVWKAWWAKNCVCAYCATRVWFVITIEWFVHNNIVTSCWMCLLLVGLTLFMRDNTVWIELMHFALKYYSIWIRLKGVCGRMNVLWTLWMIKTKTAQVILSFKCFYTLFVTLDEQRASRSAWFFYSSLFLILSHQ